MLLWERPGVLNACKRFRTSLQHANAKTMHTRRWSASMPNLAENLNLHHDLADRLRPPPTSNYCVRPPPEPTTSITPSSNCSNLIGIIISIVILIAMGILIVIGIVGNIGWALMMALLFLSALSVLLLGLGWWHRFGHRFGHRVWASCLASFWAPVLGILFGIGFGFFVESGDQSASWGLGSNVFRKLSERRIKICFTEFNVCVCVTGRLNNSNDQDIKKGSQYVGTPFNTWAPPNLIWAPFFNTWTLYPYINCK